MNEKQIMKSSILDDKITPKKYRELVNLLPIKMKKYAEGYIKCIMDRKKNLPETSAKKLLRISPSLIEIENKATKDFGRIPNKSFFNIGTEERINVINHNDPIGLCVIKYHAYGEIINFGPNTGQRILNPRTGQVMYWFVNGLPVGAELVFKTKWPKRPVLAALSPNSAAIPSQRLHIHGGDYFSWKIVQPNTVITICINNESIKEFTSSAGVDCTVYY